MIRLEFNSAGFEALLKSNETQAMIRSHVDEVKGKADAYITGDSQGFSAKTQMAGTRWIGIVGTTDLATMIAESEQKALEKAVNG